MFRFTNKFSRRSYSISNQVHNWNLLKTTIIPEINSTAIQYEHVPTGAKYLHLDAPHDDTNAFAIGFLTPPENSNGVAHVLEHSTLCGSEKYPVRDLFFNMMKRSLNTYMNAWTASDCTAYPFATRNEKDFKHLMDIYLDAVLHPRLSHEDFSQEGHRLEFEKLDDINTPLQIKGVVYNEMKGVMSDASSYFMRKLHQYTYPGTIYANESGGDPEEIPTLTYDYLKNFHKEHYHPSNALIYTYGSFNHKEHLKKLDEAFKSFTRIHSKALGDLKPLNEPQRIRITGPPEPVSSETGDVKYAISYLTCPSEDIYETLCISFFKSLVFDEPRGVFFQNIIQSGLAPDFCGSGYDSSIKNTNFVIGVQNIQESSISAIDEAIQQTFKDLYDNGVDQGLIDSVLHSIELSIKKKTTNFGVKLAHGILSSWIHTGKPEESLFINKYLDRIKEEVNQGTFFKRIISRYFINNPHTIHLTMVPDPNHNDILKKNEEEKIKAISEALTDSDKQKIVENAKKLKFKQETKTDNSCLPTLTIQDISRKLPEPTKVEIEGNIMLNEQQTNGISYISIQVDIPDTLPVEMMPYLALLADILPSMGAGKMNYLELAEKIELHTAGISSSLDIVPDLHTIGKCNLKLVIDSMCLDRNIEKMIELIRTIYLQPWLDSDLTYLSSILQQSIVSFSNSIVSSGNSHAKKTASSVINLSSHFEENLGGIEGFKQLNHMLETEGVEGIVNKLKSLTQFILNQNNIRVLLTAEPASLGRLKNSVESDFLNSGIPLPQSFPSNGASVSDISKSFKSSSRKVFIPIPAQINFVSSCVKGIPYYHDDSVLLILAQNLLNSNYLLPEVREKGGAYGCSSFSDLNGIIGFASYRDPHTERTLNIYENVPNWIDQNVLSDIDIQEGKLAAFQSLDYPTTPHAKASRLFKYNITNEIVQKRREKLLDASLEEMRRIIQTYFNVKREDASIAILGGIQDAPNYIQNGENGWILQDSLNVLSESNLEEESV